MRGLREMRSICLLAGVYLLAGGLIGGTPVGEGSRYLGRWDLVLTQKESRRAGWLEVLKAERDFSARFVAPGSGAETVSNLQVARGRCLSLLPGCPSNLCLRETSWQGTLCAPVRPSR